jgi:alpha-L-fucosidase
MRSFHCRAVVVVIAMIGSLVGSSGGAVDVRPPTTQLAPESPLEREQRMRWWRDARFGMFIHFGLYSIPAGYWKGQPTPRIGEWIMNDLKIPRDEYAQLARQFNPTHFDAARWAAIAKNAGMKYIVITTKHHEGFCLFDSRFTDYDVMSTPFKRDIMKELANATRAAGLKIGWYHSIMDWHAPEAASEEPFASYEWRMRAQVTELLTNYGPIGVMWFDGEWIKPWNDQRGENLYKLCRSLQPGVIVNNRVGKNRGGMAGFTKAGGFAGDYATPEQQIPDEVPPNLDWETCMTMNDTWGFKSDDQHWKSAQSLIRKLIDIASKGGNFLLNVGPTAEGDIPKPSIDRLNAIGKWLSVNGDAIYGTIDGPFKHLAWGRSTAKGNKIYLHVFDWPQDRRLLVPMRNAPTKAYLLGGSQVSVDFAPSPKALTLRLPDIPAPSEDATVIVMEMAARPDVIEPPAPPKPVAATTQSSTRPATSRSTTRPATTRASARPVTTPSTARWTTRPMTEPATRKTSAAAAAKMRSSF